MIHNSENEHQFSILLIEDTPAHAELFIRVMEKHRIPNQIFHVKDGEKALQYLGQEGEFSDEGAYPPPDLVILDLRIPKVDGLEVLRQIKQDPSLKKCPTIVLSSSSSEKDLIKAYEYHANSYLVKPMRMDNLSQMLHDLGIYWMHWNQQTDG